MDADVARSYSSVVDVVRKAKKTPCHIVNIRTSTTTIDFRENEGEKEILKVGGNKSVFVKLQS